MWTAQDGVGVAQTRLGAAQRVPARSSEDARARVAAARFQFRRAPSRSRRPIVARLDRQSLEPPLRRRARAGSKPRAPGSAKPCDKASGSSRRATRRRALERAHALDSGARTPPRPPSAGAGSRRGSPPRPPLLPRRRARGCCGRHRSRHRAHRSRERGRGSRGGIGARRRREAARPQVAAAAASSRRARGGFRGGQKRGPGFRARHDPSVVWVQRISLE